MKIKLLTAIAMALSLSGYAQTKGTSALSLGVTTNNDKTEYGSNSQLNNNEGKSNSFTLGYGLFIKDNTKLGIDLNYGNSKFLIGNNNIQYKNKDYGVNVSYQKYYPIVKTLYAYAGGRAGYMYSRAENPQVEAGNGNQDVISNRYSVGAYGGITWFVSNRFAFETTLLSANANYNQTKRADLEQGTPFYYKNKRTAFDLNTQGFINNLGFKIYLLF